MSADATRIYFDRAANELDLSDAMRRLLLTARREVQVQIPVELDTGEMATFIGYRVQHNNARGPYKGGIRYHESVSLDDLAAGMDITPGGRVRGGMQIGRDAAESIVRFIA